METKTCPDCGKVFESRWLSKVQERYDVHRARANPCTRKKGDPWARENQVRELVPVTGLEDLNASCVNLSVHTRNTHVISSSFDQMNSHEPFACMPNIDRNVVHYVFEGEARQSPLQAFVDLWFLTVFFPKVVPKLMATWPGWPSFAGRVSDLTSSYMFGSEIRNVQMRLLKRSELYRKSSIAIKNHLKNVVKTQRIDLHMRIVGLPTGEGEVAAELTSDAPPGGPTISLFTKIIQPGDEGEFYIVKEGPIPEVVRWDPSFGYGVPVMTVVKGA
jgi:hypothetical protein